MKPLMQTVTAFAICTTAAMGRADESQSSPPVAPVRVLNWIEKGTFVRLLKQEGAGYLVEVYSDEQANKGEGLGLSVVTEVTSQYIVTQSVKPVDTGFGSRLVERTIPFHSIFEVLRLVEPKAE